MRNSAREQNCLLKRLKDKFTPTRKFEDTEECRTWRSLTKEEINDQWKKLCEEIETDVLDKQGIEENEKRSLQRQMRRASVGHSRSGLHSCRRRYA